MLTLQQAGMFSNHRDVYYGTATSLHINSQAADLGLSSFDIVSIISDFENEFDMEIPDGDIRKFVMVNDIIEYVQGRGYQQE